ncbi:hypothetical protein QG37_06274 [Candidozyma auris]|nr:hypothetical protein QG37_06274 [[Candida] auris]
MMHERKRKPSQQKVRSNKHAAGQCTKKGSKKKTARISSKKSQFAPAAKASPRRP